MDALFVDHLKNALNNLYNLKQLGQNPLCATFNLSNPVEAAALLQRMLKDGVSELKPKHGEPRSSNKWQVYELLSLRYVQQFSQKEIAGQLGISISKLNRVQQTALEMLAVHLLEKYNLASTVDAGPARGEEPPSKESPGSSEYAWAAMPQTAQTASLPAALDEVLQLIRPLMARYPIHLEQRLEPDLPEVVIHPLALQQILINILTTALQYLTTGQLSLRGTPIDGGIRLTLEGQQGDSGLEKPVERREFGENLKINLKAASDLASLSGGSLDAVTDDWAIKIDVKLPVLASIPVLVVDDNEDSIRLLEHYVENTHYRLHYEPDPRQAIDRAQEVGARVVIVDVMMPRLDGWNLLQYLRNTPALKDVPMVVSSILRQEELALSLGANAFLPKPVTQQDLLTLLYRLTSPEAGKLD